MTGELERRVANVETIVASLEVNMRVVQNRTMDHEQRFDTLQSRWWKRLWFRVDGWPGIIDLNANRRSWRPWHRRTR